MSRRNYIVKLDTARVKTNTDLLFYISDMQSDRFTIKVTEKGQVLDLSNHVCAMIGISPSNKVAVQYITEQESNILTIVLQRHMMNEVGQWKGRIILFNEEQTLVLDTFGYIVQQDELAQIDTNIQDDDRTPILTDLINQCRAIIEVEAARVITEQSRVNAEIQRVNQEQARVEAEQQRANEYREIITDLSGMQQEFDDFILQCQNSVDEAINRINSTDEQVKTNEQERQQAENIRQSNEEERINNELNRQQVEAKRVLAEQDRSNNYSTMVEAEEERKQQAIQHHQAEQARVQAEELRVQAEELRVQAENQRHTVEQARVLNEEQRVQNEQVRQSNETTRQSNFNALMNDAQTKVDTFDAYTINAIAEEEQRVQNELARKQNEDTRVQNENKRITAENTRVSNEDTRVQNETNRQNIFSAKVTEVNNKITEVNKAKSDMTTTVSNKVSEVETRFNALTSSQQQDAEVIDARDGETSLKARLDRDVEKAKQVYVNVEGSHISTDSSSGYAKDVEILGNTVQDASNLADIRSVGDTVEGQELYEIPVLSCGKNLVDNSKRYIVDMGHSTQRYVTINNGGYASSSAIFYLKQGTYSFSIEGFNLPTTDSALFIWKKDKVHSNARRVPITLPFTIEEDEIGITFYLSTPTVQEATSLLNRSFMIEEGTVATPYEPYQEDKLTILSPTPLEKVGDVADRIIEKDGVWGVEKNINTVVLNGSEGWYKATNKPTTALPEYRLDGAINDYYLKDKSKLCKANAMSNKYNFLGSQEHMWQSTIEGFGLGSYKYYGVVYVSSNYTTLEEFKQNFGNLSIKYQFEEPQFIPLPHDQQIKLRTFANKTNISFLTEIEGTIKAQVPKSLGATVNTHTEQISNLNKELDRVKKLEESTVSTVTTESDFTTVEATSNGYFEDVKLEGKTLVNLFPNVAGVLHNSGAFLSISAKNLNLINGKSYTILFTGIDNSKIKNYKISRIGVDAYLTNNTFTVNIAYDIDRGSDVFLYPISGYTFTQTDVDNLKVLILEGDHTQNPPSYFEGLKSVGEGADEIVVSSVNGDGNLFDENVEFKVGHINTSGGISSAYKHTAYTDYILLEKGDYCINTLDGFKPTIITIYNSQKVFKTQVNTITFTLTESSYIRLSFRTLNDTEISVASIKNIMLNKGTTPKPYTPHQSDKKPLLYYNNETQAWEKPILREWDSIEKHADGKYYYHQRSGEVVLNGSENATTASANEGLLRFYIDKSDVSVNGSVKSDRFNNILGTVSEESVYLHPTRSQIVIVINASKLSTQDVAGFKKWLQANNVTVVYQLAQEKVYECTNIDLITYANETNYIVECGAIVPRTTLKVLQNAANIIRQLQQKVSVLEQNESKFMQILIDLINK